jgi:hypothetical protein
MHCAGRLAMIGLLVSGAIAESTAPQAPRAHFWRRVLDWLLGR